MNDLELKAALEQSCPVLPGQEARAWRRLQERLAAPPAPAWLRWQPLLASGAVLAALLVVAVRFSVSSVPPLSAASQSPGIFATAFYSPGAHAQVVWLNGLGPATDGPTYMDRTGQVDERTAKPNDSL